MQLRFMFFVMQLLLLSLRPVSYIEGWFKILLLRLQFKSQYITHLRNHICSHLFEMLLQFGL